MKKHIDFSPDLKLPVDVVTQTLAFLAKRGAGKTYSAGKLAEGMFEAGGQVIVIDPVGNWYGLRLSADGKGEGLKIPVFGGGHGDIPLEPTAGRLIAKVLVENGISVVLDVSHMRKGPQKEFIADFAEEFYELKKGSPSPVHLFVEECQRFVPQKVWKGAERMLGAMEDLIKLGRNYGIGVSLISQRPQAVNKDVLNQTECLVVLQTIGTQERKAITDWIVEKGIDVAEAMRELPSLPTGTAFVWSPGWLGILKRVKIGRKRTFDASATPKFGEKPVKPRDLTPVDLASIKDQMAATIKKAAESDPKALRKRVAELEGLVAAFRTKEIRDIDKKLKTMSTVEKVKEVPVLSAKEREALESLAREAGRIHTKATDVVEKFGSIAQTLHTQMQALASSLNSMATSLRGRVPTAPTALANTHINKSKLMSVPSGKLHPSPRPRPARPPPDEAGEGRGLSKGAREMLKALVARNCTYETNASLTRTQVATLAGLSPTSGTFNTYLSALRSNALIGENRDGMFISAAGLAFLGDDIPAQPTSTDELVSLWSSKLSGKAKDMLRTMVGQYPEWMTKEQLGEAVDISSTSGTFNTYLSALRSNGLVESEHGQIRASESLFL